MSEHTNADPEVLTDHTDIICSTSIERIVTGRNAALQQTESIIHQLAEISALTRSIGGKTALDWGMKQDFRCGCWLMERPETAMKAITRNIDRGIWKELMKKSGMLSLMDAQARDEWYKNLEREDIPAVSKENILSTFKQLHLNKARCLNAASLTCSKGCPRIIWHSNSYEDEMFAIKYFQKVTAHITFRRPELVDKLNDIIARHYLGMLACIN